MIRVLHVFPQLNNAGTEMVIMNLYKNIDRSQVQFDFLVQTPGEIDDKVKEMGGNIYYIGEDKTKEYYKRLLIFFNEHKEYNIVHTHTHLRMGLVLKAANKCGIKHRIAHSHTSRPDLPKIARFLKKLKSRIIENNATDFLACSLWAAQWLFPTKYKHAKIVHNAIDLASFRYDAVARQKLRKDYGIGLEDKVICHIGRFSASKNHKFILEIARELVKKDKAAKFLLVGTGDLLQGIKARVTEVGMEKNVVFLGNRSDINAILSASDVFILPSFYEGLGIVLIEAQANGLNCIISDNIPPEADLGLGLITTRSLSSGSSAWSEAILNALEHRERGCTQGAMPREYDVKNVGKMMQDFYVERGILHKRCTERCDMGEIAE